MVCLRAIEEPATITFNPFLRVQRAVATLSLGLSKIKFNNSSAIGIRIFDKKKARLRRALKIFPKQNQGALYLFGSTPGAAVTAVGAVVGNAALEPELTVPSVFNAAMGDGAVEIVPPVAAPLVRIT